jgi:hypothetical protein
VEYPPLESERCLVQCVGDDGKELIGIEGLGDEPRGAAGKGTRLHGRVATRGHDGDRQRAAHPGQSGMQLEVRHARHVHISDHAAPSLVSKRRQEVLGAFEGSRALALQPQQQCQ